MLAIRDHAEATVWLGSDDDRPYQFRTVTASPGARETADVGGAVLPPRS